MQLLGWGNPVLSGFQTDVLYADAYNYEQWKDFKCASGVGC